MRQLLGADVLIGALDRNDVRHDRARALLTGWRQHRDATMSSVVNLSEVLIAPAVDAARLRHRHPVSLPDADCLATARHTNSMLATFDRTVLRAATTEGLETI